VAGVCGKRPRASRGGGVTMVWEEPRVVGPEKGKYSGGGEGFFS